MSERDGYNHLYLYTIGGNLVRQVTKGEFEVKDFLGWDQKNDVFYYTSNEESPLRSAVYKIDRKGKKTKLSTRTGTNTAIFNTNLTYYINKYSSKDTPTLITINDNRGRELTTLLDNFSDGGMFEAYMADHGYISVCVDGRGTGGRGAAFEKCTYLFLGVKESHDQVETARYLGTLPYVDANRIGIWGWSYGGYTTLMSMSEGTPVFKAGVAIAAPSDWHFYDTVYTERFMRTPKENGDGYRAGSAILRAPKLHGNLLLIHGTADDNVHYQNCAEYSEALVQAGIQFDMQIYTNRNHGISGGNTRTHLMNRVANFFIENL